MTTKKQRDALIEIFSQPSKNEDATFNSIRESILAAIKILCQEIDDLQKEKGRK